MNQKFGIQAKRASDLFVQDFPPNPSYIEPAILTKGGTLLLGGLAKVGKSLMMLEIIRSLTCTKPLFDFEDFTVPQNARCLYIEAENGERSIKARGAKIFEKEDKKVWEDYFYTISKEPLLQLDTYAGQQHFKDLIKDVKPNVLILDPMAFMGSYDENKADQVGKLFQFFQKIKELGQEQELSLVISHHFGKPPWGAARRGYDPLSEYNFRGSSKWKDGPDSLITIDRCKEITTVPHEAWILHLRFLLRHESSPDEMFLEVNKDNDFRMHFERQKQKMRKLKVVQIDKVKEEKAKQEQLPLENGAIIKKSL